MCLFVSNSLLFVMFVTEETPVSFAKAGQPAPPKCMSTDTASKSHIAKEVLGRLVMKV